VLLEEMRKKLEKGRVKEAESKDGGELARKALEPEERLRKMIRGGMIKLFDAVRAADIKGEGRNRVVKREEKGMIYPSHMGVGIWTNC